MNWSPEEIDTLSVIANEAGIDLRARLEWMTINPQHSLIVGAQSGKFAQQIADHYPTSTVTGVDNNAEMVTWAQAHYPKLTFLPFDGNTIPLATDSVDLIIANLFLPWIHDELKQLQEWRRVLKPHGLLMFSSLGPDTLRDVAFQHDILPNRIDMHEIGDLLIEAGFCDPVLDVNYYTITYQTTLQMLKEMKIARMVSPDLSITTDTPWELTFEVVQAHAWVPEEKAFRADEQGVARIPLSSLRRR